MKERLHDLGAFMHAVLNEAGIREAWGGFDVSLNEHETGAHPPVWSPHAVLFIPERYAERIPALRQHLSRSPLVPRPLVVKRFDGRDNGSAYATKIDFVRRVTLDPVKDRQGRVRKRRNTRDRPLRAVQKVELMLALDELQFRHRLFLHGVRLVWTPDGMKLVAA